MKKKSLATIEAQISKLKAEADHIRKTEVGGVIARIREAIAHYGLTAADLGLRSASAGSAAARGSRVKPKAGGVPKYRDPATGKTWTGRGKPPTWIAGVADRSRFLIEAGSAPATVAKRRVAKPKRGGIAKYQDPASGKTWTGVGKPPAWIAGVADRSAFLIGSAAGAAGSAAAEHQAEAAPVAASPEGQKPGNTSRSTTVRRMTRGKAGVKRKAARVAKAASAA